MRITLRAVDGEWEFTVPDLGDVPIRVDHLADVAPTIESLLAHLAAAESSSEQRAA